MSERFDGGRLLIGIGALALLVSLFMDWYQDTGFDGFGVSAWTTFEIVDILLAGLALAAILAAVTTALPRTSLPSPPAWTLILAGPVALVLVAVSLIDRPPAARGASLEPGAWVALAAAILMALGAFLAVARISLVVSVSERGARGDARDDPDDVPPKD